VTKELASGAEARTHFQRRGTSKTRALHLFGEEFEFSASSMTTKTGGSEERRSLAASIIKRTDLDT